MIKTLTELHTVLSSIDGFESKVAYHHFEVAPDLPWICYLTTGTENFGSDNVVTKSNTEVDIELYSRYKDLDSEALIENALYDNECYWEKIEDYLEDEKLFRIIYQITI